jgi:hypothetical protein
MVFHILGQDDGIGQDLLERAFWLRERAAFRLALLGTWLHVGPGSLVVLSKIQKHSLTCLLPVNLKVDISFLQA